MAHILVAHRLLLTVLGFVCLVGSATHDELSQCGLSGVYKTRQSIITSPNYPNPYPTSTCWDYVIRSPYRCPTKFHIQFLDFYLESSENCTNDYLAIGLENDGDDMDVLCGQVIGIKKYHTPGGILRLRFLSDDSVWTTGRGFKLLVTRLACERENFLHDDLDANDGDTEQVLAPSVKFVPPAVEQPQLFRNWSQSEQHKLYPTPPLFGWNLPAPFPTPPTPTFGASTPLQNQQPSQSIGEDKSCLHNQIYAQKYPQYTRYPVLEHRANEQQRPESIDQYMGVWPQGEEWDHQRGRTRSFFNPPDVTQPRQLLDGTFSAAPQIGNPQFVRTETAGPELGSTQLPGIPLAGPPSATSISLDPSEQCCTATFHQRHFYLSSPGFPRTAFTSLLPTQQRDCQFELEKHTDSVCRVRVEFKFFDFGQHFVGTGDIHGNVKVAISTTRDVCTEDFLEINGERFCGCRTGYVYTSAWILGPKQLRMRMGYSGIPSSGFLLEIYQEECHEAALANPQQSEHSVGLANVQNINNSQTSFYNEPQPILGQQQSPIYQQQLDQIPYRPLQTAHWNPLLIPQRWPIQPLFAGSPIQFNQFRPPLLPYRRVRMYEDTASTQQAKTVVEPNSSRKQHYVFNRNGAIGLVHSKDEPDDPDRMGFLPAATVRDRCSFSTMDALRLTMDSLWLSKPICYAPLRNWFSNIFG